MLGFLDKGYEEGSPTFAAGEELNLKLGAKCLLKSVHARTGTSRCYATLYVYNSNN